MKAPASSKETLIRDESELVQRFRELLADDRDLRWRMEPAAGPRETDRVELEFDGNRLLFHAVYELKPSRARLAILRMTHPSPLLLVTPEISARLIDYCRDQGLAAMDLNGRVWLRGPGLLVDRGPRPGRAFRYELEPRNFFEGKSARILRCLLTDRDRHWTQADVLARTRASMGLVSRIVTHLISHGYIEKLGARQFRVGDPHDLLDAWVVGDRADRLRYPARYECAGYEPLEIAGILRDFYSGAKDAGVGAGETRLVRSPFEAIQPSLTPFKGAAPALLFTREIAAALRCPVAPPATVASAHVSYLPTARQLEVLGLRPVAEGGNVQLFVPRDEGIFLETQTVKGLPLTTDAQICLDLQLSGDGGAEAAAGALRGWGGFCRA